MRPVGGILLLVLVLGASLVVADQPPRARLSGKRAWGHVRALLRFGARLPGSNAHRRAQAYIVRHLRSVGAEVEEVNFVVQTPRGVVTMKNILGKIPGRSSEVVVLGGHYDTKKIKGFVGANDGGSSTALLLELAQVLSFQQPNPLTVWVVFFDGEEAFSHWSESDGLYGSRYQASAWQRDDLVERIKAVIVVDMIGDKELALRRDLNSTPWLTNLVWEIAHAKGYQTHFLEEAQTVADDHVPFVEMGVPAVDLIDMEYGPGNRYWHTPADTVDKLSARSFEIVGEVVLETVSRLGERWPGQAVRPGADPPADSRPRKEPH